jgi:hypothetical protein
MDNGDIVNFKTWVDNKRPGTVIIELDNGCTFELKVEITAVMFNSYDENNGLPVFSFSTQNVIKTLKIPKEVRKIRKNDSENRSYR